jgi:acyl carrier protein
VARRANARDEPATADRETSYSLAAQMERHRPTLFQCTPSMLRMIALEAGSLESLRPLRTLLLGGEALPPALARQVQEALPARLINVYGPTETTIWSTVARLSDADPVSLGRPIANTQVFILDDRLEPVPIGAVGELYIAGDGVARGYIGRPALTAERFVPSPFAQRPGARMYRTGDLGRHLADGRIEYLGRADHQVKLRGHRIELGEIEGCLGNLPGVRECVVALREERLVAYVVQTPDGSVQRARARLRELVPEIMVPTVWVELASLPRTLNGKIDRSALFAPASDPATAQHVEPNGAVELALAAIWIEILGVERIGANAHFFDAGGHSLLAMQMISRVRRDLGVELPIRAVFETPTLAALARRIEAISSAADASPEASTAVAPRVVALPREPRRMQRPRPADDHGVAKKKR